MTSKHPSKIAIFSFFSGAGFLDLGFDSIPGFQTVFANEIHTPFAKIYCESRSKMGREEPALGIHTRDIRDFLAADLLGDLRAKVEHARQTHELVGFIGGPPCPDFSVGGKNKGKEGENGRLSSSYQRLISAIKPDFFLFENVRDCGEQKNTELSMSRSSNN